MKRLILSVLLLPLLTFASGQWIWGDTDDEQVMFIRWLKLETVPATARLRVLGDFADVRVYVNNAYIGRSLEYGPMIDTSIVSKLAPGDNRIRIHGTRVPGPSAVAVRLDGPDGLLLASDKSWSAAVGPGRDKKVPTVEKGALDSEPWSWLPPVGIGDVDDYEQWQRAKVKGEGTDAATIDTLPGYSVERLRSAAEDDNSWLSIAFDPKGRIAIGREDKGVLRFTLSDDGRKIVKREMINNELREVRGLLYHDDSLFVQANSSKALFRLHDSNGDDTYDSVQQIYASEGGGGHGRNGLALGPDGKIYAINGDSVKLPKDAVDRCSPLRRNRQPFRLNEGHVVRMDPDGSNVEIFCAGLRNPYGIAFSPDGEAFTYDADAEHDMGAPWYRPTQVKHLVSGADFGWRAVTRSWPSYFPDHPDNAQPSLTIGKGSPTGVLFGTGSQFPIQHKQALFVLDWTYGRILAVHLHERGAGYVGQAEVFLQGRPLNLTDATFGPDGAMYFVTGGRRTQSALYRVRWSGGKTQPVALSAQQKARRDASTTARKERRRIEAMPRTAAALSDVWPYLGFRDPVLRYAARIALEQTPVTHWRERALNENEHAAAITALTALAATGTESHAAIARRLTQLGLGKRSLIEDWLYLVQVCLDNADAASRKALLPLAEYTNRGIDRRLADISLRLDAPDITSRVMTMMRWSAGNQHERIYYLYLLRHTKTGWTPALRREYFAALNERYIGGRGLPGFIKQIRKDVVATLTADEKAALGELSQGKAAPPPELKPRKFVRNWTMQDLQAALDKPARERDLKNGRELFDQALCSRCHRFKDHGEVIGPDLTYVNRRFSRKDLLESIIEPSKVVGENYRTDEIELVDGKVVTGQIIPQLDYRKMDVLLAKDPLDLSEVEAIPKVNVKAHRKSNHSIMPPALLNTLTESDILDLLHWLEQ